MINPNLITTSNSLEGYKITQHLGIVHSFSWKWYFLMFSYKKINQYYQENYDIAISKIIQEAEKKGANAIINLRCNSATLVNGAIEIMIYGAAVRVELIRF